MIPFCLILHIVQFEYLLDIKDCQKLKVDYIRYTKQVEELGVAIPVYDDDLDEIAEEEIQTESEICDYSDTDYSDSDSS